MTDPATEPGDAAGKPPQGLWEKRQEKGRAPKRRKLLAEIQERRSIFANGVKRAKLVKASPDEAVDALVTDVLGTDNAREEFGKLEDAAKASDFDSHWLSRRAADLARLQVHLLPVEELAAEGRTVHAELIAWRVPTDVLACTRKMVEDDIAGQCSEDDKVREAEMRRARSRLMKVLETYDYWDQDTDWFFDTLRYTVLALFIVFVLSLFCALGLLCKGDVGIGFILAGLSGASGCIRLKLPSLSVFGEFASFAVTMTGRAAAGMVAAAMGLGALTVGLINIPLMEEGKALPLSELLNSCAVSDAGATVTTTEASAERPPGQAPSRGGSPVWRLVRLPPYKPYAEGNLSSADGLSRDGETNACALGAGREVYDARSPRDHTAWSRLTTVSAQQEG